MPLSRARKEEYIARLHSLLGQYNKCFMVDADNVGSQQMHNIRHQLRGKAEVIMGKNVSFRQNLCSYGYFAWNKCLLLLSARIFYANYTQRTKGAFFSFFEDLRHFS